MEGLMWGVRKRKLKERKKKGMVLQREIQYFWKKNEKDNIKMMIELAKEKELNSWRESQVYV